VISSLDLNISFYFIYDLFDNAVSSSYCMVLNGGDDYLKVNWRNVDGNGCGTAPGIFRGTEEGHTKHLGQCPSRDSNRLPPEYKSKALLPEPFAL
jgi:hypothetical protein